MLGQLSIQNYRIFSHFELDNIALVNLIVGSNNSGKSSLLEAIYLLTSDNATDSLFHILDKQIKGDKKRVTQSRKVAKNFFPWRLCGFA